MSQMMHRQNYPQVHECTEASYKKLARKERFRETTFEEYQKFCAGKDCGGFLQMDYEFMGRGFATRGQFLNWLLEKRLKDGRVI